MSNPYQEKSELFQFILPSGFDFVEMTKKDLTYLCNWMKCADVQRFYKEMY